MCIYTESYLFKQLAHIIVKAKPVQNLMEEGDRLEI